jgi:hypothetical protein
MEKVRTNFIPGERGFRFVNSFPFPFSVSFKLPFAGQVDLGDIIYGLCGGMCFASLDYFYAGKRVPGYQKVQEIPNRYLFYLWDRQLDSLGLLVVPRVIEWMLREDINVGQLTARNEIPKLRRRLDKGLPCVLALIRTSRGDDPTRNHQVLATGYDYDPQTGLMTISLYEPNYPGKEPSIQLNLAHPSKGIHAIQSTGEPLRGFFLINYRQQQPLEEE